MMKRRLDALFLTSIGILIAAAIAVAAAPALSEETAEGAAGASSALVAEEHAEIQDDIGFPQLKTDTYASQVFWLAVFFVILYALMSKIALPRVTEVIDMRATQKNGNLSRAEALQEEATKIKAAYEASLAKAQEAAQSSLASASEDIAEKIADENSKFAESARKRIAAAEQALAKAKADASASLADISAEIAAEIVGKIADTQIAKQDAKKAVLAEMQKG